MPDARPTDDGDFRVFVDARWPLLVRTLVLLGCPVVQAPDVVTVALARCRTRWRESVEYDDPDVVVQSAVIAAWAERVRGTWWTGLRSGSESDWPTPDLSALDRMTPDVRAGVVLRRFASLDATQVAAVAGAEAGGALPEAPDAATLRAAGESVPVFAPPQDDDLRAVWPGWWRRRRLVAGVGVVAVTLVLAGGTWWANQGADQDERRSVGLFPVDPHRSPNPADVAWYAEDVLHLANATYVLPTLRDLTVLGAGAAYGDDQGRVVYLADDGTRTLLGVKDPVVPFATSDALGWVAWVDPDGTRPRLLVYDVDQAELIGELDLPVSESGPQEEPDTRPVAIDQETVYFVTAEGARAWRPVRDPGFIEEISPPALVDVSSANRVYQLDSEQILIDRPFVHQTTNVPGRGGELSEDGELVLTHDPADGTLVVYEVDSGDLVYVHPPDGPSVVDAVLAPDGAITYLTIDPDAFATQEGVNDSHPIKGELVTCLIGTGSCEAPAMFVLDSEAPILAR